MQDKFEIYVLRRIYGELGFVILTIREYKEKLGG
jgi:hypothetical protein